MYQKLQRYDQRITGIKVSNRPMAPCQRYTAQGSGATNTRLESKLNSNTVPARRRVLLTLIIGVLITRRALTSAAATGLRRTLLNPLPNGRSGAEHARLNARVAVLVNVAHLCRHKGPLPENAVQVLQTQHLLL